MKQTVATNASRCFEYCSTLYLQFCTRFECGLLTQFLNYVCKGIKNNRPALYVAQVLSLLT